MIPEIMAGDVMVVEDFAHLTRDIRHEDNKDLILIKLRDQFAPGAFIDTFVDTSRDFATDAQLINSYLKELKGWYFPVYNKDSDNYTIYKLNMKGHDGKR